MIVSFLKKILFLLILNLHINKTFSILTNHEAHELFGVIQKLKNDLDDCNKKYNNLVLNIIKNKTNIKINEFLTPCPHLDN